MGLDGEITDSWVIWQSESHGCRFSLSLSAVLQRMTDGMWMGNPVSEGFTNAFLELLGSVGIQEP